MDIRNGVEGINQLFLNIISKNKILILIYHRVFSDSETCIGGPNITRFDWQMRLVEKNFNVITLSQAISSLISGNLPNRALVLTFDDGYKDNCTNALPVLKRYGLKATFFICSDYLDGGIMWNDKVAYSIFNTTKQTLDLSLLGLEVSNVVVNSAQQKKDLIHKVLKKIKYASPQERDALADQLVELCESKIPDDLMMSSSDVVDLHRAGMEIGGHTLSHPILSKIEDVTAENEIIGNKKRLEALIDDGVFAVLYEFINTS